MNKVGIRILLTIILLLTLCFQGANAQDWQVIFDSSKVLSDKGKHEEAAKVLETVMASSKKAYQNDSKDTTYAISLGYLGLYYELSGKFQKAEDLYKECIEVRKKVLGENHVEYLNALNNLGVFYIYRERFPEAHPVISKAVEASKKAFGGKSKTLAINLGVLGEINRELGKFAAAEELYLQSLKVARQMGDSSTVGTASNNLAVLFTELGQFYHAENWYRRAIKSLEEVPNSFSHLYNSKNNLASLYTRMGRFEQAHSLYQKTLKEVGDLLGKTHPLYARSLGKLGTFSNLVLDKPEKAVELLEEALKITSTQYGDESITYAYYADRLAAAYRINKQYEKGKVLVEKAVAINLEMLGDKHWRYAHTLENLSLFYSAEKSHDKAEGLLKESLEIHREKGENNESYWQCLLLLCKHYIEVGQLNKARLATEELLAIHRKDIEIKFFGLSSEERRQTWDRVNGQFEMLNSLVLMSEGNEEYGELVKNMYDNQIFTKSLLLTNESNIQKNIRQSKDSILIQTYDELTNRRNYFAKAYSMTKQERAQKEIDLLILEEEINELERKVSLKSNAFLASKRSKSISWKQIQQKLKPDEAAIEVIRFRWWEDKKLSQKIMYVALILTYQTRDQPKLVVFENGAEMENELIDFYEKSMKHQTIDRQSYKHFWKPIQQELKGIKTVFFSPDGIYHLVNLETLFNKETNSYLFEDINLRLVTTTKEIVHWSDEVPVLNKLDAHLFGNPIYHIDKQKYKILSLSNASDIDHDSRQIERYADFPNSFEKLPHTESEVNEIASLLLSKDLETTVYLAEEAREEHIKNLSSPKILHIATHGFFGDNKKQKQESKADWRSLLNHGLVLAGAVNYHESEKGLEIEDGLLTAYESSVLDLDDTELVVLSACETGLGKISSGEGVYGLQRGLRVAGANSVLMSLWNVNDLTTKKLMITFYKEWLSGKSKSHALRIAKQQIRKDYPHPYHWGSFVLVGEDGYLPSSDDLFNLDSLFATFYIFCALLFFARKLFTR